MNHKRLLFWRHRPDGSIVKPRDALAPGTSLYEVSNSVNAAIAQIRSGGDSNSDGLMKILLLLLGLFRLGPSP